MPRVSDTGPGGENPFGRFLGDLMRNLQSAGPVHWDTASRYALQLAGGGASEPNPEPLERMRWEELARVADLRVSDLTGLSTSTTGRPVSVAPVTRAEFARRTLDAFRPLFERQATSLLAAGGDGAVDGEPTADEADPLAMLTGLFQMIGPMFFGMSTGSLVGHLANRSFTQYDVPVPRPRSDELLVVPATVSSFAESWSLDPDDLRLWLCVSAVATHAVLGVPAVRDRLEGLLLDHAAAYEVDPAALEARFGDLDPGDPSSLGTLFDDPRALLGMVQSSRQRELLPRLEALLAVVVGYTDWAVESIGGALIGSHRMITEALHRRRVEASEADHFAEQLLGLSLGVDQYERGAAFVAGVVERAGPDGLTRLWASERELPTPAEVDAPGLWLARIDLPEH